MGTGGVCVTVETADVGVRGGRGGGGWRGADPAFHCQGTLPENGCGCSSRAGAAGRRVRRVRVRATPVARGAREQKARPTRSGRSALTGR